MPKLIAITPNIAANGRLEPHGFGVKDQDFSLVASDYANALIKAGACPMILAPSCDEEYILSVCKTADALLLSGGPDLDPALYNEPTSAHCGAINSARDAYEMALLDAFYKHTNKPILGICRGMQLLNVYLGGSLHQDLKTAGFSEHCISVKDRWLSVHDVSIARSSWLESILSHRAGVNSYHHQGIKDLAPKLRVLATSDDGLIEAIELEGERFVAAVQWHPEMMAKHNESAQEIFNYFVDLV